LSSTARPAATGLALSAARSFLGAHWRLRTLDPAALQAWQEERARQVVAYAAQHSPFYRRHWQGHDLQQWRSLPTVDKAAMMAHFDEFNTCGVSGAEAMQVALAAERTRDFAPTVGGLTVGLSSGTSGHRGLFLVSPQEQAAWAGVMLARALHGLRPRRSRVAFFLRSNSNLYRQVNGALLHLRYFDLMAPIDESVAMLNGYDPHVVVGPPSLLGFLANAQEERRLRIAPERLISVAEVLEPQDKARLGGVFGAPVHEVYQCTEGLLAVSCAHGSLHIQEDIVAIQCEPLQGDGAPEGAVAGGEAGAGALAATGTETGAGAGLGSMRRVTPIVTDLWRRTQPIIRYRLNDLLRLDERPCACGSHFRTIAAIEGRSDDVCYFPMRNGHGEGARRPFFPDTLRRLILLSSDAIADYKAVQARDGELCVHLAPAEGADLQAVVAAVRKGVSSGIEQYGCLPPRLEVDTHLPPLPAGAKRRRVQRLGA
jgi:phenylacetate-CoA ligase